MPLLIFPGMRQSLGTVLNGMGLGLGAIGWSSANKAIYIPFQVSEIFIVDNMYTINGGTVSGNIDVGIYEHGGTRLVSSGSTAQAGASSIQEFNVTNTTLNPGLYYFAVAVSNTTATLEMWTPTAAISRSLGVMEETSAFPLPSTATFASISGTSRFPFVGAVEPL